MEEFARSIGISRPTVSKYFADPQSVRPSMRRRIEDGVRQTGYQPNFFAANLSRKKPRMMGVIVPSISDPFYSELVRLVEQKAEERGYRVFVLDSHGKQDDEVEAFATLMSVRAAGILVASVTVDDTGRQVERFPSDIPVVAMDAPVGGNIPFVGTDNTRGVDELVRYMCRTGDPPAYFAMPNVNRVALERRGAYEATMRRLGNEPLVIEPRRTDWDFEAIGYEMGQLFFRAERLPCRSVVCANDRMAFGVLAAAFGESIKVGRGVSDVRVAGHDDHPLSRYMCPPLTTVAQDIDSIAEGCVSVLVDMLEGRPTQVQTNRVIRTVPKLVLRDSA